MKRYKLLKDLPTFKAGQLAYISKTGNLIAGTPENQKTTETGLIIMIYHETTLKKFPNILTEWFKEVEEPMDSIHWKPKIGDRCFILENANIRPANYTGMLRDYNAWCTGKMLVSLYATQQRKKLKNLSKKMSKIGRLILELTRQIQIKAKCTLREVRRKQCQEQRLVA